MTFNKYIVAWKFNKIVFSEFWPLVDSLLQLTLS